MLEIKREESFFVSKDDKIFTTKEDCLKHEKKILFKTIFLVILLTVGIAYVLYETNIMLEEINKAVIQ